jgi:hypothetical protein
MSEEGKVGDNMSTSGLLNLSGVKPPEKGQDSNYTPSVPLGVGLFTIIDVTQGKAKTGTAYLEVKFNSSEGIPFSERFYITPGALPRIMELFINSGVPKEDAQQNDMSLERIKGLLEGRSIRLRIEGEEFENRDGKVRVRRTLNFRYFSELASVPAKDTKLYYNEEKHIKKITKTDKATDAPFVSDDDDDLPWEK